jgi:hypothetical protein
MSLAIPEPRRRSGTASAEMTPITWAERDVT